MFQLLQFLQFVFPSLILVAGCVIIVCIVSGWLVCGVECVLWLGDGWYSNDIIMISWWSITCLIPALLLISARIYGFLVSLPQTGAGWTREPPLWDNNWHKIEELCVLVTDHPSPKPPCEMSEPHYLWSPHNCWWCRCWWRGRGRTECRVVMYWCHLSYFFTQAWYITSHPSTAQHSSAMPYSDQAKLEDTRILRYLVVLDAAV